MKNICIVFFMYKLLSCSSSLLFFLFSIVSLFVILVLFVFLSFCVFYCCCCFWKVFFFWRKTFFLIFFIFPKYTKTLDNLKIQFWCKTWIGKSRKKKALLVESSPSPVLWVLHQSGDGENDLVQLLTVVVKISVVRTRLVKCLSSWLVTPSEVGICDSPSPCVGTLVLLCVIVASEGHWSHCLFNGRDLRRVPSSRPNPRVQETNTPLLTPILALCPVLQATLSANVMQLPAAWWLPLHNRWLPH